MTQPARSIPDSPNDCIARIRHAAGWHYSSAGWLSYDNTPERQWRQRGYPLPEDLNYGRWFRRHHGFSLEPFSAVRTV